MFDIKTNNIFNDFMNGINRNQHLVQVRIFNTTRLNIVLEHNGLAMYTD